MNTRLPRLVMSGAGTVRPRRLPRLNVCPNHEIDVDALALSTKEAVSGASHFVSVMPPSTNRSSD
jgi:hypothetical protein